MWFGNWDCLGSLCGTVKKNAVTLVINFVEEEWVDLQKLRDELGGEVQGATHVTMSTKLRT